jgi:DUF1009 family protein
VANGLAIVAGRGALPRLIAEDCAMRARPYLVVVFEGTVLDWIDGHPVIHATFEKPGRLFAGLRAAGCGSVTFAGGLIRPSLKPLRFDLTMLRLAPRLLPRLKAGDDSTLRMIAAVFEAEGFAVEAPHEILTDLVAPAGVLGRVAPGPRDRADAGRAAAIVAALGTVDVGQAAVVAGGVCLGAESIQGTDALLDFVARTGAQFRRAAARGVLFKGPKPSQDRRMDLPAIGPATVRGAAAGGLAGVAVEAGGVMVLEFGETVAAADAAGIFLWGREP